MGNAKKHPSQKELQLAFEYKDGQLFRKTTGKAIGTPIKHTWRTYIMTQINGIRYSVHRLIWIHQKGELKSSDKIDHIDNDSLNNHIDKLTVVTDTINAHNRKDRKPTWCIKTTKYKHETTYRAYTKVNGKLHYAPSRKTLEEAQADRDFIYHLSDDKTKLQRIQELKPSQP